MEEKVFFDQGDVSVSNARFMVYGQTYAMNGVTSVKRAVKHPFRLGPIVLGFFGLAHLLISMKTLPVVVIILALAAFWWKRQKSEWFVVLNSASGETQALTSKNSSYIDDVISALNNSIIHRG
jgi:hypothetical protein